MISISHLTPWQDPRGGNVQRILLDNGIIKLEVLSLGGIIRTLEVADKHGTADNIVLGCDNIEDYLAQQAHLGAVAGRYANRVANGQFSYQGQTYQLSVNQASNCLHGGEQGFNLKHWQMQAIEDGVRLTLLSPDGDMGFPGNCQVQLDYRLNENKLMVEFTATTDKPCPVSLTQHSYFNLGGSQCQTNTEHLIEVDAKQYMTMNEVGVPTAMVATQGSDLDLSTPTPMSVQSQRPALAATNGFDHCYVLAQQPGKLTRFGSVSHPSSGRIMTVYTNQVGVQLYGANFLEGTIGYAKQVYQNYQAVCIEPQLIPDSPNQPQLPGAQMTTPEQPYKHVSCYEFTVKG
ncbi:aldose epimerase family protein [Shewanella maritima]|uniref:aldose epimerase family protein n=1 Tax=Shewanella maritima TaxID=2520507 RepID=UPI00373594CE